MFISGQKGPEVMDGEGLAEALSPVPVHNLQDLIAPVELIKWLYLVYLIIRLLHNCVSISYIHKIHSQPLVF